MAGEQGFPMGPGGLERRRYSGFFGTRGVHGGVHRASTYALYERFPVDFACVEQRVRVGVRGDELRALPNALADVGPRLTLPVE